jgi:hypothetical protein
MNWQMLFLPSARIVPEESSMQLEQAKSVLLPLSSLNNLDSENPMICTAASTHILSQSFFRVHQQGNETNQSFHRKGVHSTPLRYICPPLVRTCTEIEHDHSGKACLCHARPFDSFA